MRHTRTHQTQAYRYVDGWSGEGRTAGGGDGGMVKRWIDPTDRPTDSV